MEEKLNTIQSLIGVLNSPIAQRKGVTISPEQCKIWVEELSKFMQESGWRPASELPPVDKETGLSDEVIAIQDRFFEGERVIWTRIVGRGWKHDNIKWWCYPPKEE